MAADVPGPTGKSHRRGPSTVFDRDLRHPPPLVHDLPPGSTQSVEKRAEAQGVPIRVEAPSWFGESGGRWAEAWGVPYVEVLETVDSTNNRMLKLAGGGAPLHSVVVAGEQTAGRGRRGRSWYSPAGSGLYMSILVGTPDHSPTLPLLAGIAAARAVESMAAAGSSNRRSDLLVGIKWPNDLMLAGRKIGGVLCEGVPGEPRAGEAEAVRRVVMGIGLNLSTPDGGYPAAYQASSAALEDELGPDAVKPECVRHLAAVLVAGVVALAPLAARSLPADLHRELARRDVLKGRTLVSEALGRGTALEIAPDGTLEVETPVGGIEKVRSGSVSLVEGAASKPKSLKGEERKRQSCGGSREQPEILES